MGAKIGCGREMKKNLWIDAWLLLNGNEEMKKGGPGFFELTSHPS